MRLTVYEMPDAWQANQDKLKRLLDVIIASSLLILFSPLIALIAILVRMEGPGGVVFRHQRIGKDGKPFNLFKFRTMASQSDDREYMDYLKLLIESERGGNGIPYQKMDGDARITRLGGLLRKYYLDELPQFVNVLKGEMSIVGPRPHVQFEVDYYTAEQRRRLKVRPGATGLWQVQGKADCTFNELLALDLDYIDRWSLGLDIRIMLQTVSLMLHGGEGVWGRMGKVVPRRRGGWLKRGRARRTEMAEPITNPAMQAVSEEATD
jgi:lipopolysaccharide/colanic/teichoic acid biosynthesis glycosyltransferase